MNDCIGVILAGGLARRMGGGDKPLVEIAGRPILQHVIDRLKPQCGLLAINANGDPARFSAFGLPVICDSVEGFAGPLAGILAGMDFGAAKGAAHVLSAPGDTPFLPADLRSRLQAARASAGATIAVAASNGRIHHAVALWPVALREDLRRALVADDERKGIGLHRALCECGRRLADRALRPFLQRQPTGGSGARRCDSQGRIAQLN